MIEVSEELLSICNIPGPLSNQYVCILSSYLVSFHGFSCMQNATIFFQDAGEILRQRELLAVLLIGLYLYSHRLEKVPSVRCPAHTSFPVNSLKGILFARRLSFVFFTLLSSGRPNTRIPVFLTKITISVVTSHINCYANSYISCKWC